MEKWSRDLVEGIDNYKEKKKWVEVSLSDHGKIVTVMTVKNGVEELRTSLKALNIDEVRYEYEVD
jgi:predicted molibdopterin-dependent oxidoreductase YjgC